VGCQNVFSILLHDITCIFSRPAHLCRVAFAQLAAMNVFVGLENVFSILLQGIVCIFVHPTHLRRVECAVLTTVDAFVE